MKYKKGDKVRIKSIDWYNKHKDKDEEGDIPGQIYPDGNIGHAFIKEMSIYCGKIATIRNIFFGEYYSIDLDNESWVWTNEMFEGLIEETYDFLKTDKPYPSPEDRLDNIQFIVYNELKLPEGYIFKDENGNIINATKIVLEKKKKEYPKTFKECCKVLGYDDGETFFALHTEEDEKLFDALYCLKICRDAYWKIAGEELGLEKPWEPDYDSGVDKFGIICLNEVVQESNPTTNWERHLNKVFDFPTAEMRGAFKDNFYADLEFCKELL